MASTTHTLIAGRTYAVTPVYDCTITTSNGTIILSAQAGSQTYFVAPEPKIVVSDSQCLITETFKGASVAVAGGGASTTIDSDYNPDSMHAQSGVSVRQAIALVETHVFDLGVMENDMDITYFSLPENGTTAPTYELWFELGDTRHQMVWPMNWIWLEGNPPDLQTNTAYRVAVRRESADRIVANLAYFYDLPTQN